MNSEWFLKIEHAAVGYDRRVVLPDVNLTLQKGSFTGLLGANGSGKSTLIKTILGIIPPLSGRIEFAPERQGHVLGYTPQRDALDPIFLFSSFEVVLMGTCGRVRPGRRFGPVEKEWAHQCLRETESDHLSRKLFSELSGGQKQRVLLARALATKPDFLLLDEPTSGIDAAARRAIMELLRRIHSQGKLTIVLASHDLPLVRSYVEEVVWLHHGKLLQGSVGELLSPEKIEEIFELETL